MIEINSAAVRSAITRNKDKGVHILRTTLKVVRDTANSFTHSGAVEATAGLAYFSFFSFFPLILILVAAASSWLTEDVAQLRAIEYVTDIFPISPDLLQNMIQALVDKRFTTTVVSSIGLLWASSGFFSMLIRSVNRAWPDLKPRPFVRTRLEALGIVILLGLLFILSIVATSAIELIDALNPPLWNEIIQVTFFRQFVSEFMPMIIRMLLLWALYYYIPKTTVNRWAAFISAVIVTLGWRTATNILTWYLSSGFARYNVVYGSLGTTVASLFWLYASNYILVLGAHLTASLNKNFVLYRHQVSVGALPERWYFRKRLHAHAQPVKNDSIFHHKHKVK